MKILMVTPYLPYPPASGGQIRTLNLLKYLSKKNDIVLVALYKKNNDKTYLPYLTPYCKEIHLCKRSENPWQLKNIFTSIFSFQPFLIVRNFSPEAKRIIERLLKNETFDVIHTETFYVMPHIPKTHTPILLVEQTVEFKVYQHFVESLSVFFRFLLFLDILKLRYWEKFYWKKATLVATVSESDKKIVSEIAPTIKPVVIPNGAGEDIMVHTLGKKNLKNFILLFQGNFSWLQNVEAADYLMENIFPRLKNKFPNMKLVIAGQHARKISKDDRMQIVDISHNDTTTVKNLYQQSLLFIAPIFGPGGTRLKILAAMASGLPVVSSKTGVEGLDVKDGEHVLIANNPREFEEKIGVVLSQPALYEKIRRNAHRLILEKYNWEKIAQQLEITYKKITRIQN